jgi:hypothetical protein
MKNSKKKNDKYYEEEGIKLENFIKNFIPPLWKEKISSAVFVPLVLVEDIKKIYSGEIPKEFDTPYFRAAIKAWIEKRNNNNIK